MCVYVDEKIVFNVLLFVYVIHDLREVIEVFIIAMVRDKYENLSYISVFGDVCTVLGILVSELRYFHS